MSSNNLITSCLRGERVKGGGQSLKSPLGMCLQLSMDLPLVLTSAKFFVLLFVQLCGPSVDSGFWRMTSLMV